MSDPRILQFTLKTILAKRYSLMQGWVIETPYGLQPPIDDDGTHVFMVWPTREEALRGLQHQRQWMSDYEFATAKVVRLF